MRDRPLRGVASALGRRMWAILGASRGVAAVEFALILPTAMVIMIGLFDFGLGAYQTMALRSAARAGGQYALINPDDDAGLLDAVLLSTRLDAGELTVTDLPACRCSNGTVVSCATGICPGNTPFNRYVEITVSKPYSTMFPYPGLPSTLTLSGVASFRTQ